MSQEVSHSLCRVATVAAILITMASLVTAYNPHGLEPHMVYGPEVIQHHSIEFPLLENYLESGLRFWSFGGNTVVDNRHVRLTRGASDGHGYLWNQFPSGLESWQANFTFAFSDKVHHWTLLGQAPCTDCGAAFWFLSEPTRHAQAQFYGVPANFKGIGVVIPTDSKGGDKIHIVQSDGSGDASSTPSLDSLSVASCPVKSGDVMHFVLTYTHAEQLLEVKYSPVTLSKENDGKTHTNDNDHLYYYPCEPVRNVELNERYYFGFTGQAAESHPITTDLIHFTVAANDGTKENKKVADESKAGDFDQKLDTEEKQYWKEKGDADPFADSGGAGGSIPSDLDRDDGEEQQQHHDGGDAQRQRHHKGQQTMHRDSSFDDLE